MAEEKFEWMVSGDQVEGCTSPPVCPAMWNIRQGYDGDIDLSGLVVQYAFNSPSPFPPSGAVPWLCILIIDEQASAQQAAALEKIFSKCWNELGDVIGVKRAKIEFTKELVDGGPVARYTVISEGRHHLETRPFRTQDGRPRYVNSHLGGHINVGVSKVNEFNDPDLPRGK